MPFHPDKVTQLIEDVVERYVIGWEPFKIESLWRILYSSGCSQHPDLSMSGVLSGIEMACWDIIGKSLDQPIYNLLGGQVHEKLRLIPTSIHRRRARTNRFSRWPTPLATMKSYFGKLYLPSRILW